jgi:preprotein translocase subunit SecB
MAKHKDLQKRSSITKDASANAVKATTNKPSATAKQLGVTLDRISLRRLSYNELSGASLFPESSSKGPTEVTVNLEGRVNVFPQGVELYLELVARPDPAKKPIEISAGMSAFFKRLEGVSDDDLLKFAQGAGLRIIFPYLREVVSSVTGRGLYGTFLLNPLHVQILTNSPETWQGQSPNSGGESTVSHRDEV